MSEILDCKRYGKDLFKVGLWMKLPCKIDALSLHRRPFPEDIRRIRMTNHISQAAFAAILGIGKTTVQQWEQGQKKPSGPAQRLLDLIDRKGLAALA